MMEQGILYLKLQEFNGQPIIDNSTNPATMKHYTTGAKGTLTLTVTDADGGSSTLAYQLPLNQFVNPFNDDSASTDPSTDSSTDTPPTNEPTDDVVVPVTGNLVAGNYHTCAQASSGSVKCWGFNYHYNKDSASLRYEGVLGIGKNVRVYYDTRNSAFGDQSNEMGGSLPYILMGTGRTVKQIDAGGFSSCAILDNDRLKCWGRNRYGQLGLGDTADRGYSPETIGDYLSHVSLGGNFTPLQVSLSGLYNSEMHSCALLLDNPANKKVIKCWGSNSYGQLGIESTLTKGGRG